MKHDRYTRRDGYYRKLINSSRWQRLRTEVLIRHPLCQDCEANGLITPATEVHHITPIKDGINLAHQRQLAYDSTNLRALCHACHVEAHRSLQSYSKDKRKERVRRDTQDAIAKLYGRGRSSEGQDSSNPGGIF